MNKISIYIHSPFCKQKCFYCDFVSFNSKDAYMEEYYNCLEKEIYFRKEDLKNYLIDTIYFGGGTPSHPNSKYIVRILSVLKENFNIKKNAEITIESNPESITKEKLSDYLNIGFNRLSMGLQSANNTTLREIGRIHTYEKFVGAYTLARNIGFKNINIDLMFSLPNETIDDFKYSLDKVINLKPEHISTYSLILEEHTKLYNIYKKKNIEIDDDLDRQMYHYAINKLKKFDYNLYEISNFSKKGYESKHNLNCWDFIEYIGFGCNASSYINKQRIRNSSTIEDYINNIKNNKLPIEELSNLNNDDIIGEYIMLALRKTSGLNIPKFNKNFNIDFIDKYKYKIKKTNDLGLTKIFDDHFFLTKKGLDYANTVMIEFI